MLHLFFLFVPSITGYPRIILLAQYIQTVTTRNTTHCTYTSKCHTPHGAVQSYGPQGVGCDNPGRGVSRGFPGLLLLLKRPRDSVTAEFGKCAARRPLELPRLGYSARSQVRRPHYIGEKRRPFLHQSKVEISHTYYASLSVGTKVRLNEVKSSPRALKEPRV